VETGRRPGKVYRRAGRPCPRCRRERLRSAPQGAEARTTYWCPGCQH
ncbi:MAG: DNA glycosylase, partial [Actinomycetota bacterium]|nr:DNA glycosylase [Actinomycetota bacterium]